MVRPRFEDVFAAECGYVVHSLRRLGIRAADLEDVAQDVFLAVHRRWDDYDPARPIRHWLFAYALRAASNHRRLARHRREVLEPASLEAWEGPSQEHALARDERRRFLYAALEALDLKHRAAIVLVDLDGVPAAEAAQILDAPLDTVYSRVRNGRKKLREALVALGAHDEHDEHDEGGLHG